MLSRVNSTGCVIAVTKRGKPIAHLVPAPAPKTWLGQMREQGQVTGDIVSPIGMEWDALES